MTARHTILIALATFGLAFSAGAQEAKNMLEVGAHGGYLFVSGDVKQKTGFGGGIHVRKALDHVFSIRVDLMAGKAKGETKERDFESNWMAASALGVMSLNNFKFGRGVRKLNYYFLLGAGVNRFETNYNNEFIRKGVIDYEIAPQVTAGAGVAFRLGKRVNIGLEYEAFILVGRRADLIDGSELEKGVRSPFRDIVNYPNLRFNFNLGNSSSKTEPLYWVNPLDVVLKDVDDIKKKQDEMFVDTDGDGVIDALDQEPETPADAPVDTKGRTLDSDKDGIADYKDKEPYYPPRAGERVNAEGIVENPISRPGAVTEDRVQEMIDEALAKYDLTESGRSSVTEWFLPMIHFPVDSYTIKYADYGTLAGIGRMMKGNADMRLVVLGYTDQTGSESYNDYLSYQRANAVIEHLVNNFGIGRGRFVLQWGGKNDPLVPANSSYMNRRVEFRAASATDVEMDPPAKTSGDKSGY